MILRVTFTLKKTYKTSMVPIEQGPLVQTIQRRQLKTVAHYLRRKRIHQLMFLFIQNLDEENKDFLNYCIRNT